MSQIVLEIPEDSLLALRLTAEALGDELRMAAAVKLFEMGRLSSGAAARLAGVPRPGINGLPDISRFGSLR